MKKVKWTEKEIELLKAGKPVPGRSKGTIRNMRCRLGLTTPCINWKTPEMQAALASGICPEGIPAAKFSCARYNHGFTDRKKCKKWTKKEKALLLAGKDVPGRSKKAINCMRCELRMVRKLNPWTAEEIEQIKRGEKPAGRSINSIRVKRCELGITGGGSKCIWLPEEIAQLQSGVIPKGRTIASAITMVNIGKIQVSEEVKNKLKELRKKLYRENCFKSYKKGIKVYQSQDLYRMDPADIRRKMGM